MRFSLTKSNIADQGLSFFFEVCKDLVISKDFIETLYRVIIKVARTKLKAIQQVPEMPLPDADGNEIPEEEKLAIQKKIDEVLKANVETEKINEEINKFQSKVKIAYRAATDITKGTECALMRVSNYREPKTDEF